MRPLILIGVVLIVLGIIALAVPSFTYFTEKRAVDSSFLKIDVKQPHTIVLNPIAGIVAVAAGVALVVVGRKSSNR